jgi:hypothetical protein
MTSKIMAMDRPLNSAWHQCKIITRAGVEGVGRDRENGKCRRKGRERLMRLPHRQIQTHTGTCAHMDTHRHIRHTDTDTETDTDTDTHRHAQTHGGTRRHTDRDTQGHK